MSDCGNINTVSKVIQPIPDKLGLLIGKRV